MNIVHMIHSVPAVVSLIIAAVFVAMSGIAVAASLHARKIARTIASVKTSQIAAASDSYLALEGTVKAVNGRTLPREKFLEVNRGGSKAALFVAALPLRLAATFLWLRFG